MPLLTPPKKKQQKIKDIEFKHENHSVEGDTVNLTIRPVTAGSAATPEAPLYPVIMEEALPFTIPRFGERCRANACDCDNGTGDRVKDESSAGEAQ